MGNLESANKFKLDGEFGKINADKLQTKEGDEFIIESWSENELDILINGKLY